MKPLRHIVLVTQSSATVSDTAAALSSNGQLSNDDVLHDLQGLVSRLERGPSPAVIIDLDSLPASGLNALEPIVKRFPDTRFVVVATELRPQMLLDAMQVGARHFLLKKAIVSDLNPALHKLCPTNGQYHCGNMITVLSAGGGCGATTLAVNLANELQLLSSQETLIVDLDTSYSTVPSYLGLQGQFGVMELLNRTGAIDNALISSAALASRSSLHVLPATATSHLADACLSTNRLGELLQACRDAYTYTVIDAPRVTTEVAKTLALESRAVLIVMQLTIKDLRVARLMIESLLDGGISSQDIVPIVGRYRRKTMMIDPQQAQRALNRDSLELLSNDFVSASHAINLGQPLAVTAPRSLLRREIQQLSAGFLRKYLTAQTVQSVSAVPAVQMQGR